MLHVDLLLLKLVYPAIAYRQLSLLAPLFWPFHLSYHNIIKGKINVM
jgi:hypothetical protein